jgi:hypothetical protein
MSVNEVGKRVATALETISGQFGGPGVLSLPLFNFVRADTGAPLAVFANAAAGGGAPPGTQVTDSKAFTIRWNNDSAFVGIATSVNLPRDFNPAYNATLKLHVSKTGANAVDATTFVIGAFNQVVGALHDADADFGGTSSAITAAATAKTIQSVSRTLALADLASYPSSFSLTIAPTAGVLATDDLMLHRAYIEYTRKNPT